MSGSPIPVGVKVPKNYPVLIPWELPGDGTELEKMFGMEVNELYEEFNVDPEILRYDERFNTSGPYLAIYSILNIKEPPGEKEIDDFLDWVRNAYNTYGKKVGEAEKAEFLRVYTKITVGIDKNGWYEEIKGLKKYIPEEASKYLELLCEYAVSGNDEKRRALKNTVIELFNTQYFYAPYEAPSFAALVNYWKGLETHRKEKEIEGLKKLVQAIVIPY